MAVDRRQPLQIRSAKVHSRFSSAGTKKNGELLTEQPPFAERRAEFAGKRQRTVSRAPYRDAWQ
jgi:hypothetical protein